MSRLHIVRDGAFRGDPPLKAEVAAVVACSFIDDVGRLEREFARCDTLYLLRDEGGELASFFMASWEALEFDGHLVPALYTGLTAARPDRKHTGEAMVMYDRFVANAQTWERQHGQKLIVWGMTATPVVYILSRRLFVNVQPSPDGTYSEAAERVAHAVRRRIGAETITGSHPFAFPGAAAGVRYTEEERLRVAEVSRAKQFTLFDQVGLDESRGDRMLFVAEVPAYPDATADGLSDARQQSGLRTIRGDSVG
jgi:hypothetical protein